jgi:hypothetical protein
VSFASP